MSRYLDYCINCIYFGSVTKNKKNIVSEELQNKMKDTDGICVKFAVIRSKTMYPCKEFIKRNK